jgi:hypothetical protein
MEKVRFPKHPVDTSRSNLICFLLYNYGSYLETYDNEKDSYGIFKNGLEFAISMLGEINMFSNMFQDKLNKPIYSNLKKEYYLGAYGSINNTKSIDSCNVSCVTKTLDKSDYCEDLLSRHLRKRSTGRISLTKKSLGSANSPVNFPKRDEGSLFKVIEKVEKNSLEDSLVSGITNTDNSDIIKTEDNKSFSMDNCKIEIKATNETTTDKGESFNTIIETQDNVVKKQLHTENIKSSTIDNTVRKTSRLKQLFSMATTASSNNLLTINKKNSINSTPKIMSIFDRGLSFLKKKSSMIVSPSVSLYHEVMSSIDHNEIPMSKEDVPLTSIDQYMKRKCYTQFVSHLTMQKNFENLTGTYIPKVIKITPDDIKSDDEYVAQPFFHEDQRLELNGKKVEKKELLKFNLGKQLVYNRGVFSHICNEIDYKYFEDENNCKL